MSSSSRGAQGRGNPPYAPPLVRAPGLVDFPCPKSHHEWRWSNWQFGPPNFWRQLQVVDLPNKKIIPLVGLHCHFGHLPLQPFVFVKFLSHPSMHFLVVVFQLMQIGSGHIHFSHHFTKPSHFQTQGIQSLPVPSSKPG